MVNIINDIDPPIPGQKYLNISFFNPTDQIEDKNVFKFRQFTRGLVTSINQLLNNVEKLYPESKDHVRQIKSHYDYLQDAKHFYDNYKFFCDQNYQQLEDEYGQISPTVTTPIVKIRGVFEELQTAKDHAKHISKIAKEQPFVMADVDVFTAQVGKWLPICRSNAVENQVYESKEMNNLFEQYQKGQAQNHEQYQEYMQGEHANKKKQPLTNDEVDQLNLV